MNQEQAIKDILEIVEFMKDNMVTRDEHRESLFEVKSEIMSHVDSFVHLHNKPDTELTALRGKYDRLAKGL